MWKRLPFAPAIKCRVTNHTTLVRQPSLLPILTYKQSASPLFAPLSDSMVFLISMPLPGLLFTLLALLLHWSSSALHPQSSPILLLWFLLRIFTNFRKIFRRNHSKCLSHLWWNTFLLLHPNTNLQPRWTLMTSRDKLTRPHSQTLASCPSLCLEHPFLTKEGWLISTHSLELSFGPHIKNI